MTPWPSEVGDLDTGLLLEVWEKGLLWDRAIGYYWCTLTSVPHTQVRHAKQTNTSQTARLT